MRTRDFVPVDKYTGLRERYLYPPPPPSSFSLSFSLSLSLSHARLQQHTPAAGHGLRFLSDKQNRSEIDIFWVIAGDPSLADNHAHLLWVLSHRERLGLSPALGTPSSPLRTSVNPKPSRELHLTGDQRFWHRVSLPPVFSRIFTLRICGFPDTKFSPVDSQRVQPKGMKGGFKLFVWGFASSLPMRIAHHSAREKRGNLRQCSPHHNIAVFSCVHGPGIDSC